MITFDPYIPLPVWFPLALAAVAAVVMYGINSRGRIPATRRVGILTLMLVAVGLPLVLLLNPTWVERLPPPAGKPLLTILVDKSASMATRDATGSASRYSEAVEIAMRMAQQLDAQFELRFRVFDVTGVSADLQTLDGRDPDGPATDLASALEESLDDRPQGQAMLLLSDGIHNSGGGASRVRRSVEKARAIDAPIYVKTIGQKTSVKDLQVALNLPQEMAFVGQSVPIVVSVQQRGAVTDRTRLSLLLDDQVVDQQELDLAADETTETTFVVNQTDVGLYRYEVRADSHPEEVTSVNNVATLMLRVVDEPVRVLLLEGKPYWDTKFLIRTLASDRSIDLTSVVRMAPGRFLERRISRPRQLDDRDAADEATPSDNGTPTSSESDVRKESWEIHSSTVELLGSSTSLSSYQIIVLGRDAEVYLDDTVLAQIKKWLVQDNGSLVCSRGPPSSQLSQRLGELMPVRWTPARERRFRVQLTESGQAMRWLPTRDADHDILAKLPSLATVSQPEGPKPLAVVLATAVGASAKTDPVISYQPIGNGRVVVVEGAGMWRWAFLPSEFQEHDELYGLLWRSLVRWLVSNVGLLPSQRFALSSDKVTFSTNELATGTLLMHETDAVGDPPQIELTGDLLDQPQLIAPLPAGSSPGQFRVVFGKLPEGRYRARVVGADDDDAGATTAFDLRGSLAERLDVAARPDLMKLIADESGGVVLQDGSPSELSQEFAEHLSASLPQRTIRVMAWDRWWVLASIFGLWAATWGLRRRTGLV